jgi:hypothetical protein
MNQTLVDELIQQSKGRKDLFKYKNYYIQKFNTKNLSSQIIYVLINIKEEHLKRQFGVKED